MQEKLELNKICKKCGLLKELNKFSINAHYNDGRDYYCALCRKIRKPRGIFFNHRKYFKVNNERRAWLAVQREKAIENYRELIKKDE